jgi:hypothetical protein
MNRATILGLIRHLLTTAGGALAATGAVAETDVEMIAGGLVALIGVVWSVIEKRNRAAALPPGGGQGAADSASRKPGGGQGAADSASRKTGAAAVVLLVLLLPAMLAACAGDAQTRATAALAIACDSIGTSLGQLAPLRAQGRLTAGQVKAIGQIRDATAPACASGSAIDPAAAVVFVEAAAGQLKSIFGGK